MLGRSVKNVLEAMSHDVITAKDQSFEKLSNGALYVQASTLSRLLITCDNDFSKLNIGRLGSPSII